MSFKEKLINQDGNELQDLEREQHIESAKINSPTSNYLSNVHSYETEWRNIKILAQDKQLTKLKHIALSGDLKVSKFRSICWNILLGALVETPDKWLQQRREQRQKYSDIKTKYNFNPHTDVRLSENLDQDNPLSQENSSAWNQHFRDQELCSLIKQDVVRTNPTVDFYHKENIQEIMINILFLYAREFPKICYRQGMHEILAPLIFVIHCDHQNLGHIMEMGISVDSILTEVLDPNYLEQDAYHMFLQVMSSLELFYRINDMTITQTGQIEMDKDSPTSPTSADRKKSEIEVVNQLNMIRDKIFAKQDLHLHNHLLKLDIPLSLFGIRWLRLLFGREFTLQDLLILWDAIFAVGDDLQLTHYILVAMLIHIRDKLLSMDYTSCLTLMMRYPQNADTNLIIRHALYMYAPDKYQCPPNAFVYLIADNYRNKVRLASQVRQSIPSNSSADYRNRSNSLPKSQGRISARSRDMRNEAAINLVAQSSALKNDEEFGIVDGYLIDDPEVLKMELQDAFNLMSVSRLKLMQYAKTLRKYIPGHQVDELHQTLDGIEELCSLLKPKHQYLFNMAAPVDPAIEATNETSFRTRQPPKSLNIKSKNAPDDSPKANQAVNTLNSRYEVPDNKISKTASRLIHNRKEVEMHVFHDFKNFVFDDNNENGVPRIDPAGDRRNSE